MKNTAVAARVIEAPNGTHTLGFTAPGKGTFKLRVHAVGLDSEEPLDVAETNVGSLVAGAVLITADSNQRVQMNVKLSRASLGTYRLTCEEVST